MYANTALVEATGGISPPLRKQMHALARRTQGRGAVDRTCYGRWGLNTKTYYKHHEQQLSKAAVLTDAAAIRDAIVKLKATAYSVAHAAPAGGAPA